MSEAFTIRRAGVSDAPELGRIHSLAWRHAYKGIASDAFLEAFTPEKRAAFFARIIPKSAAEQYLLYDGEDPIGLLALGPATEDVPEGANWGEVIALYLLPEGIGRGLGSQAMRFALDRLGTLGFGDTVLTVLSDNARAIRFYTSFGFAPDGDEETIELGRTLLERRYRLPRETAP